MVSMTVKYPFFFDDSPNIQRQLDLSGWVTKMNFTPWGAP